MRRDELNSVFILIQKIVFSPRFHFDSVIILIHKKYGNKNAVAGAGIG